MSTSKQNMHASQDEYEPSACKLQLFLWNFLGTKYLFVQFMEFISLEVIFQDYKTSVQTGL